MNTSRVSNFVTRFSSVGHQQVQAQLRGLATASNMTSKNFVRGTYTMQNATKAQIRTLQHLERTYAKAMLPGVKSFGGLLNNITNLNQALKHNTVAGRATAQSIMNMSKNATTYQANARGMLTSMQKMRVMSHALSVNISSLAKHYQALATKMQWTGRQMMVGLSVPMAAAAFVATKAWNRLNEEATRLQKVVSAKEFKQLGGMDNILKMARKMGHEFAVVDEMVVAVMADFAAMGYTSQKQLKGMTELSLKMASLGDVDISDSTRVVRTVMEQFGGTIDRTTDILAAFNRIENETAIGLKELVPAFPQVAASAEAFGLSAQETVSAMAAMYEKGIPASEVAHSLKYALASLISPTKKTADAITDLQKDVPAVGNVLAAISEGSLRGRKGLVAFAQAFEDLKKARGSAEAKEMLVGIVGKRQVARILSMFKAITEGEKELADKNRSAVSDYTSDWARATRATGQDFATLGKNRDMMERELRLRQASDAFKYKQSVRDIKSEIASLGQELSPILQGIAVKIGNIMKNFGDFLKKNPGFQKFLVTSLLVLAALGPMVYITAQLGVATTTLARGFAFLIPRLGHAAGGFLNATDAALRASMGMTDVGGAYHSLRSNITNNIIKFKQLIFGQKTLTAVQNTGTASTSAATAAVQANTAAYTANAQAKMAAGMAGHRYAAATAASTAANTASTTAVAANTAATAATAAAPASVAAAMRASMAAGSVPIAPTAAQMYASGGQSYAAGFAASVAAAQRRQGWASKYAAILRRGRPDPFGTVTKGVSVAGRATPMVMPAATMSPIGAAASQATAAASVSPQVAAAMQASMAGTAIPKAAMARAAAVQASTQKGLLPKLLGLTTKGATGTGFVSRVLTPIQNGIVKLHKAIPAGGIMASLLGSAGGGGGIAALGPAIGGIAAAAAPIAAIVAAIMALIAALAAVSGHWDSFVKGLKTGIKPAVGILKSAFKSIIDAGKGLWKGLMSIVRPITDTIGSLFGALSGKGGKGGKEGVGKGWNFIGTIIGGIGTALAVVVKFAALTVQFFAKILQIAMVIVGFLLKMAFALDPITIGAKRVLKFIGLIIQKVISMKEVWRQVINFIIGLLNSIIKFINMVVGAIKTALLFILNLALKIMKSINNIPVIGELISDDAVRGLEDTIQSIENTNWEIGLIATIDKEVTLAELKELFYAMNAEAAQGNPGAQAAQPLLDAYVETTRQAMLKRRELTQTGNKKERDALTQQLKEINARTKENMRALYNRLPQDVKNRITFKEFGKKIEQEFAVYGYKGGIKFHRSLSDILASQPPKEVMVYVDDEKAIEAAQKFSDAFRDKMNSQVDKLREAATQAFEAMAEAKLKVFDDQIKAIEATEKAEQELYETEKYLAERRKMLQNQQTNAENYRRNRAVAIYEGRYDDARMLDLEFQKSSQDNAQELQNLDDERQRTLIQKERDAQKARIEEQKKAAEEQLAIQKKAFEDQLALITEYTPRNIAQLTGMIDSISGLLSGYGAKTLGDSWTLATDTWATATEQAGRAVEEEAYWAGVGAALAAKKGILEPNPEYEAFRKGLTKEERRKLLKFEADQAKAANQSPIPAWVPQTPLVRHKGGMIGGSTAPTDVPAVLQSGEYVIQRKAVDKLGIGFLNRINKYHEGGLVGMAADAMLGTLLEDEFTSFLNGTGTFGGFTKDQVNAMYRPRTVTGAGLFGTGATGGAEAKPTMGPVDLSNLIITPFQEFLAFVFPEAARWIMQGSTYREGSAASFHGSGQALDIGGAITDAENIQRIFDFLVPRVDKFDIVELIFKNMQYDKGPGWRPYAGDDHYSHIHVAVGRRLNELIANDRTFFTPLLRGGKVPVDNLPALLHKGEVVLPANIVRSIEAANGDGAGGDTYICVDTFIGQRQWFESMMKEYNMKSLPADQRRRGTMNRVVSSRKDNTVRYV